VKAMSTKRDRTPDSGVPLGLTPRLIEVLGVLENAPPGTAEATIALLPYGSRTNLVAHGFIERMHGGIEDAVEIQITEAGWDAIHACANARRPRTDPQPAGRSEPRSSPGLLSGFLESLQRQAPTVNLGQLSARLRQDD